MRYSVCRLGYLSASARKGSVLPFTNSTSHVHVHGCLVKNRNNKVFGYLLISIWVSNMVCLSEIKLKMPKGQSEAVNLRRTDNAMDKQ